MAVKTRPTPDDFQEPKKRDAASKNTVDTVLSRVVEHGNTLLSVLFGLLAAVLILYSGYILYDTVYTENTAASAPFDLLKYKPEIIDNGATPDTGSDMLAEINKDYRAWLTVYETGIDYPVVQGTDDLYYANHDVYGNAKLTGSIYLAAANAPDFTDSYNVIYGHHMDNGAMFGWLHKYEEQSYFNAHREGLLVTTKGVFDLNAFAYIETDAYEKKIYDVGDRMDEVLEHIRAMQAASDGTTVVRIMDESALKDASQVVALSTCRSAETNGRLVVLATMTRRNLMNITAEDYDGEYDAATHSPGNVKLNYEDDTTVSYSLDGGKTWTEGLPEIRDVGTVKAILKAENPYYGVSEIPVTLNVKPKPITIKVLDKFKVYGDPDPEWETEEIAGIVDGFTLSFTLRRTNADEENVGIYEGVIIAEGEERQGNYALTYLPGDFRITAADTLAMLADGYEGTYDGKEHGLTRVEVNFPEGTVIEYSTDGGKTWTTEEPKIKNVGTLDVIVRATNPNYEPITQNVVLKIEPAEVTVKVNNAEKEAGGDDPEYTAEVTGVVDDFEIKYNIRKDDSVKDEAGTYTGAIIAEGEEYQGNYHVTYENGDLTVKPSSVPDRGGDGRNAWALINLIAIIVTAYVLLPLLHLKDKYGRAKLMKKINEEHREKVLGEQDPEGEKTEKIQKPEDGEEEEEPEEPEDVYDVKKFKRKLRTGVIIEALALIGSIVLFIFTEDMRRPMVLVDKWTIAMVLILAAAVAADLIFCRKPKRKEIEEPEEKEEEKPETEESAQETDKP